MKAKLRIKINYSGVKFYTNIDGGYFLEHQSLEAAKDWLNYNGYNKFEIETVVEFSY